MAFRRRFHPKRFFRKRRRHAVPRPGPRVNVGFPEHGLLPPVERRFIR